MREYKFKGKKCHKKDNFSYIEIREKEAAA